MECDYVGLSVSDIIQIGMLFVTLAILLVGGTQLFLLRTDRKVDFTYKVYMDFLELLKNNPDLKDWLFGKTPMNEVKDYEFRIGDLLEKFEAVATLRKKGSIDEDLMYSLLSYYVELAFNNGAKDYIENLRKEESENILYSNDLFAGTEKLFDWIVQVNNNRKKNKIVDA